MSLRTIDQSFMIGTEQEAALEYARIAENYDIKVSFFISGKAVREQTDIIRSLSKMRNIELGGHNFNCFKPRYFYAACTRLLNLTNGPASLQCWEIRKTKKTFRKLLGIDLNIWRNHGYRQDKNTYRLLSTNNIRIVSDDVGPQYTGAYLVYPNLWSLPVNVLPDHDHLIHGALTGTQNILKRSLFNGKLYSADNWLEILKNKTEALLKSKCTATYLIHPCCMKIIDDFKTFNAFCKYISKFKSYFVSEVAK